MRKKPTEASVSLFGNCLAKQTVMALDVHRPDRAKKNIEQLLGLAQEGSARLRRAVQTEHSKAFDFIDDSFLGELLCWKSVVKESP